MKSLQNIKSPNIQQPRVFERKSVNKQFEKVENGNNSSK